MMLLSILILNCTPAPVAPALKPKRVGLRDLENQDADPDGNDNDDEEEDEDDAVDSDEDMNGDED